MAPAFGRLWQAQSQAHRDRPARRERSIHPHPFCTPQLRDDEHSAVHKADITCRISAEPPPSVTQAGAATRRPEQPRRRREHGGGAQRAGMPAMDARRECRQVLGIRVRNPHGSQHHSFGMMEDRNLVRTVSFGAARTGCGRGRPRPGSAWGRPDYELQARRPTGPPLRGGTASSASAKVPRGRLVPRRP